MPELPEVETVARQLAPRLTGASVRSFRIYDPLLRSGPTPRLAGRKILDVGRSGKQVLFTLSPGGAGGRPLWLAVHLRMTGRLIWTDNDTAVPGDHLRARFVLDHGRLSFVDPRRFGTMRWFHTKADSDPLGVDPLDPELTPRRLAGLIGDSGQNVKAWLLRQDRLVGLGNIYASEILYRARLSPFRQAGSLSAAEVRRLLSATRSILRRAIDNCGTTFSDFQDASGLEGSYQRYLKLYDREDRPCRRCRSPIRRVVQQQRSTYYCPDCQR
jgi:formamidopyrimidine-DNA glycosylase